jgi:putative membrane protein
MFEFTQVFKISRNNKIKPGYLLFLLPLILGFTAKGFDSSIVDKKNITLASSNTNTNTNKTPNNSSNDPQNMRQYYIENGVVVFKDLTYYRILADISKNLDQYKGKRVNITGFIYKDESLKNDEFIIARMMMSCCAADAQVVGLECKWQGAEGLKKGEWVNIEGIIDSTVYKDPNTNKDEEMAEIQVEKIERNQSPGSQYIYP